MPTKVVIGAISLVVDCICIVGLYAVAERIVPPGDGRTFTFFSLLMFYLVTSRWLEARFTRK